MADLTRSRLSLTAASGRPTVVKVGSPLGDIHFHFDQIGVDPDDGTAQYPGQQIPPPLKIMDYFVRNVPKKMCIKPAIPSLRVLNNGFVK